MPPALSNLAVKPFTVFEAADANPSASEAELAELAANVDASPALVVAIPACADAVLADCPEALSEADAALLLTRAAAAEAAAPA